MSSIVLETIFAERKMKGNPSPYSQFDPSQVNSRSLKVTVVSVEKKSI